MMLSRRAVLSKAISAVPFVSLALSLGLNIVLGWRLNSAGSPKPRAVAQKVAIGTLAPPFRAKTIEGENATIDWHAESRPTVLYIFTPTCHWCKRNLENVKHLAQSKGSSYRFVGLSLSRRGNSEYIAANKLEFPVYMSPDAAMASGLNLGPTPQTLVVSPQGKVLYAWNGAYDKENKKEIEAAFGVQLPGLTDTPQEVGR